MKENIILSIIVPVYNGEKYLDRCITTFANERIDEVELILIDDGSKDNSLGRCNFWSSVYDWIRVFHHENHGVSYTRNRGIKEAKGKYIWFVDVDDVILSDSIKKILEVICDKIPDIILFGYRSKLARKQLNEFDTYPLEEGEYTIGQAETFWNLFNKNLIHNIGNKVYRKDLVEEYNIKFDERIAICEDAMFCLNVMQISKSIYICSNIWYCYNLEENMQSLNHIYRKNYFFGVSLLYENIAYLIKEVDELFYQSFLASIEEVIRNEFRQVAYSYSDFCKFVQKLLKSDKVKEALEKVQRKGILGKVWKKLLNNRFYECYLLFKIEGIKRDVLTSKMANSVFDILYLVYKKVKQILLIRKEDANGN